MLGFLGTLTISIIPLVGYQSWIKIKRWGIFKNKKDPIKYEEEKFEQFKKDNGKITYLPDNDSEVKKSRRLTIPLKVDLTIAFIIVAIVSTCYIICGRFLLGPQADGSYLLPNNINLIQQQAVIFTSLSPILKPLFQISVFFAFFGTMYAGFDAVARMIRQITKNISPKIREMEYKRFLLFLVLYVITVLFIGVIAVLFYGVAVIYLSQKVLPKKYKLGPVGLALGIIGIILFLIPFFSLLL